MPKYQGQLSRADLFKALVEKDENLQQLLAEQLEFIEQAKQEEQRDNTDKNKAKGDYSGVAEQNTLNSSKTAQLYAQYWHVIRQTQREHENYNKEEDKLSAVPTPRQKREIAPAKYQTLTTVKDLRARLFPAINAYAQGKLHIDLDKTIDKISRAELLNDFPKKHQQHQTASLQIIDDRQTHLIPYWQDHSWLTAQLYQEYAHYQIERAVIPNGETEPYRITAESRLVDYQLPEPSTPVLLISDLGQLLQHKQMQEGETSIPKQYQALLNALAQNGNHVVILSAAPVRSYPISIRRNHHCMAWEASAKRQDAETLQKQLNLLINLATASIRLEPGLLRQLRLELNHASAENEIPASVESLVWQHPDIKEPHSVAATFSVKAQRELNFTNRTAGQQAIALRAVRQWHADLPREIWDEEILKDESLVDIESIFTEEEQADFLQDIEAAKGRLQAMLDTEKLQGENADAYRAWVSRMSRRVNARAVQYGAASKEIQQLQYAIDSSQHQNEMGDVYDAKNLPQTSGKKRKYQLYQVGNQFAVGVYPQNSQPSTGSPLGAFETRESSIKLIFADSSSQEVDLSYDYTSDKIRVVCDIPEKQQTITLQTAETELTLGLVEKPTWASSMGQDRFGLYADLPIPNKQEKPIEQRFRWIPAGDFMMGSPDNEPERYAEDEDYHHVTLTTGYWLADTTVTQAQWQAVMGKNPSSFTDNSLNPVERVSHEDAMHFISGLRERLDRFSSPHKLQLPSEAQWEYACRAGTTTPFSFGENISPKQVNYDGSRPYNNGEKGQDRSKTVAVKSLPPNPWGLYEMHGNVDEWCADAWQEQLGNSAVADPVLQGDKGSSRVVRGGAWDSDGRDVRSASRPLYSPASRYYDFGFRLSLGHELKSGKPER